MGEIKNLLLNLLKFDTQNSDKYDKDNGAKGETIDLLKFIERRLINEGLEVEIQEYYVEGTSEDGKTVKMGNRGNLIAHSKNKKNLPLVLLQGHVDTVPFSNFKGNPFGEIMGDIVVGRGACDMKGSIAGMIRAFERIINDENRKYEPILLITSDEEAKGFEGIKKFLRENKFKVDFAICGEPSQFKIFDRFKGATYRTINILGKSAHGSRPHEGKNAIYDSKIFIELLNNFANYLEDNLINEAFASKAEFTKKSTLNVGKIEGGNKVNSVPEKCKIEFELRLVNSCDLIESEMKRNIFDKIPENIKYNVEEHFTFEPLIIKKDNFIDELLSALKRNNKPDDLGIMIGFSEASILNFNGIKTIVFGPGEVKYAHSEDEQIKIQDIEKYEEILVSFFKT